MAEWGILISVQPIRKPPPLIYTYMENKTFDAYCDPGHGWIKVSKKDLARLGIADKITSYSYQRGDFAYIEEDCDASLFVKAFQERYGKKPKFREHHTNRQSKIRSYQSYQYA